MWLYNSITTSVVHVEGMQYNVLNVHIYSTYYSIYGHLRSQSHKRNVWMKILQDSNTPEINIVDWPMLGEANTKAGVTNVVPRGVGGHLLAHMY